MVPNCIFLHLFHISRSTGFLKEKKKNNRRRKKKSIPFINGMKVLKNNAGLLLTPISPSILPLISFLSWFWSFHRYYLLRENAVKPYVKQNLFLSLYPAFHNTSCIIPLLSPHLPRNISSWGQRLCFSLQDYSPSLQKSAWLLPKEFCE